MKIMLSKIILLYLIKFNKINSLSGLMVFNGYKKTCIHLLPIVSECF